MSLLRSALWTVFRLDRRGPIRKAKVVERVSDRWHRIPYGTGISAILRSELKIIGLLYDTENDETHFIVCRSDGVGPLERRQALVFAHMGSPNFTVAKQKPLDKSIRLH